jgi:hypothetical protein
MLQPDLVQNPDQTSSGGTAFKTQFHPVRKDGELGWQPKSDVPDAGWAELDRMLTSQAGHCRARYPRRSLNAFDWHQRELGALHLIGGHVAYDVVAAPAFGLPGIISAKGNGYAVFVVHFHA